MSSLPVPVLALAASSGERSGATDVWSPLSDRPIITCTARASVWSFSSHRSEEHTSELQSPDTSSYAVFCLKKKKNQYQRRNKAVFHNNHQLTFTVKYP